MKSHIKINRLKTQAPPKNCMDCDLCKVIADPDPNDWFNDDDQATICLKTKNPNFDINSNYKVDRQEFRPITSSCRPYNLRKESETPPWCPFEN